MASEAELQALSQSTMAELISALNADDPCLRTAASHHLAPYADAACGPLIAQLVHEKCLYTRIAICDCLSQGGPEAAHRLCAKLGCIGKNQHKQLPARVSAKKSYPLPRDLAARTLANMKPCILPILLDTLRTGEAVQVRECLDAVGFLVFYHTELASQNALERILAVLSSYPMDDLTVWKVLLCLSAFPLPDSVHTLNSYIKREGLLGQQARSSLALMSQHL